MQSNNFEVSILVNGSAVKEYYGNGKTYIEGREGTSYKIKIKNKTNRRIVAVLAVDGLSVIDGKIADYNSAGYVISGNSFEIIKGWRKSDDEVAEFYFSNKDEAYAVKVGKGGNQGVIGVAIFREKDWGPYPWFLSGTSQNIFARSETECSVGATPTSFKADLGTGWGQEIKSHVNRVDFDREDGPKTIFTIHYNTREELKRMGVLNSDNQSITPRAFPNEYCQPPV